MSSTDITLIIELVALAVLIIGSALMSASEVAYFSMKPEELKKFRTSRDRKSAILLSLFKHPEKLLGTILITNNIINVAVISLSALISFRFFNPAEGHFTGFLASMAVLTFILLLAGEVIPKVYASGNHIDIAVFMAYPLSFLRWFLTPFTLMLIYSSTFAGKRHRQLANVNEPGTRERAGNEDEKILKGITNFGYTNVNAIMCPRIDVTAIEIKSGFDKIIPVIINSGFSRIPVYSGTFDTVKGILYAKDVLPYANNPVNFKWQSLLRPSYFVPETKKINELLKEFQLRKIHMAVVIDEYGGTSGIVTLEDILEEIVGEITDESDEDQVLYRKIEENKYLFDAKILLHDFCRILSIEEEIFMDVRGESETLAGLMLELAGEIPQKDQIIRYGDFLFKIESVDKRRIKEILVELVSKDKPE